MSLQVLVVDFQAPTPYNENLNNINFGLARLYNLENYKSSQVNMLVDTFVNTITEDKDYVPSEIDEKCRNPDFFPSCTNGKYQKITRNDSPRP